MRNDLMPWAIPFALLELRLYLNTHPTDREALGRYNQMTQAGENASAERWTWVDDPWPWEREANVSGRCDHVDV